MKLAPGAAFVEDALARIVRVHGARRDVASCRVARRQYLTQFPTGAYAVSLGTLCAPWGASQADRGTCQHLRGAYTQIPMALRELHLKEFGAFEDATLPFVDGINVFVGPNGTGKTHVLKLLYACVQALGNSKGRNFLPELPRQLAGVFRPDDAHVGRLVRRRHGLNTARISLRGAGWTISDRTFRTDTERLSFTLHTKGQVRGGAKWRPPLPRAVFLPTREVLAMYEGFIHAYTQRELSFDSTYFDLCVALSGNPLRGTRARAAELVVQGLRTALGGRVEQKGGRFYVKFEGDRARMEAHLVGEGLRKVASLERLVLNGSLMKHGQLMWDEPEANLNPILVAVMADILGQLATNGIQIFLSTHDYLLARRLSIAARRKSSPPTRFFSFFRPQPGAPVEVEHGRRLDDLSRNPLAEEFARLYRDDLETEE